MKSSINTFVSYFLIGIILLSGTPKVYLHSLHEHHSLKKEICHHEKNEFIPEKEKCSFQKLDSPVNYTHFKTNNDLTRFEFLEKENIFFYNNFKVYNFSNLKLVRGPPTC